MGDKDKEGTTASTTIMGTGTIYPVTISDPKAITVRCPDRRFREAHLGLIRNELGLDPVDYWPLKPAGGAGALARRIQMPNEYESLMANIDLFVRRARRVQIQHIILINHQDCARYKEIEGGKPEWEREDLFTGAELLTRTYPGIEISAYYARFTEDRTRIFFEVIRSSVLLKSPS